MPLKGAGQRRMAIWALLVALAWGAAGAAPHLVFNLRDSGSSPHFFKYAFDEEFYFQTAMDGIYLRNRLAGAGLVQSIYALTGHQQHLTMILMDILCPALAALAAWLVASQLASRPASRLLLMASFLLGQEVVSLGSSSVWDPSVLAMLRETIPWGPILVPDYSTSFLSMFRTPEPQVSLSIFFLFLVALVRCYCGKAPRRADWIFLVALHLCMPAIYFFVAVSVLALEGIFAALLMASRRRQAGVALLTLVVAAAAWNLYAGWLLAETSAPTTVFFFRSRLPVLTPAVLLALALLGALFVSRRLLPASPGVLLSVSAGITVVALMNQQLVTGLMISTRDWERCVNYPLLVFGAAVGGLITGRCRRMAAFRLSDRPATVAVLVGTFGLLGWSQYRSYQAWRETNERVLAMSRCLDAVLTLPEAPSRVLTADPTLAPLLAFWQGGRVSFVIDFNEHSRDPIEDLSATSRRLIGTEKYQARLFEYFARRGWSVSEVRSRLLEELRTRGGFYSGFLFSRKDYWAPASDGRALLESDRILKGIEATVAEYTNALSQPPEVWQEPALYLTTSLMESLPPNPWFRSRPVGNCEALGREDTRVMAYLQTAKEDPESSSE